MTGRAMLHWHILLWFGMPQWLPQRCAGAIHDLGQFIGTLLSTAFTAIGSPRTEALRLISRLRSSKNNDNVNSLRAAYSAPPARNLSAAQLRSIGNATMVYTNVHSHCPTCHKPPRGRCVCRLGYSRPTASSFDPREIVPTQIQNISSNLITTAPRGRLPGTVDISNNEYIGNNSSYSLNSQLHNLAVPGHDHRLLDYPLERPPVSIDFNILVDNNIITDAEALNTKNKLLLLHYNRLLIICDSIQVPRVQISAAPTTSELNNAIEIMLRSTFLCLQSSHNSVLRDRDVLALIRHETRGDGDDDEFVRFLDYLSLQNALLGESNEPISAGVGCNFNAQALISQESSMAAIFYLIDYVTKDSMNPADLLGFIQAARLRFQTYAGAAPEGEDAEEANRPARRLAQIVQNGIAGAAEISVQQCVLNIAGIPSHDCSEAFTFIFTKSAIRAMRLSVEQYIADASEDVPDNMQPGVDAGIDLAPRRRNQQRHQNTNNMEDGPLQHRAGEQHNDQTDFIRTENQPLHPVTIDPFASIDLDYQNNMPTVGSTHRDTDGALKTTCQDVEYCYRGEGLAFLSLIEYSCTVNRVNKQPSDVSITDSAPLCGDEAIDQEAEVRRPRRGRRSSNTYPFAEGYDLRNVFEQKLKSLQTIPVLGGISSVPKWPNFREVEEECLRRENEYSDENLENYDTEENTFAEYILVLLRPWPAPNHQYPNYMDTSVQQLDLYLRQLSGESFLYDETTGVYSSPPGYTALLQPNTEESRAFAFNQRCVARYIGIIYESIVTYKLNKYNVNNR